MSSDAIERYANNRTPPRPEERRVGMPPGGRAAGSKIAKFDGERDGNRYTGHLRNDDGAQGGAIQWIFLNDLGEEDLVEADQLVQVWKAPGWLAENPGYGDVETYGGRYYAVAAGKASAPIVRTAAVSQIVGPNEYAGIFVDGYDSEEVTFSVWGYQGTEALFSVNQPVMVYKEQTAQGDVWYGILAPYAIYRAYQS